MSKRLTEQNWRQDESFSRLVRALLKCESETELADLLRDVMTLPEMQAIAERLQVARLLAAGATYRGASEITGAGIATVSRVAAFLADGEGGYRRALGVNHHWSPTKLSYEERMKQKRRAAA